MKKYQTLFFDLDDTLLDFNAAENTALQSLFKDQNLQLTPEIKVDYQKINQSLWKAYEDGKIDRDEVVNTRFSLLFKEHGIEIDGALIETNYRRYLEEGHQLIDGALELISKLQDHYDLFVVTNGVSQTQYKRLKNSGLHPLFKDNFVSEDTGYQKPMKQFFDYVFARIPDFSAEQGLIIGDSLSSDIKGGYLAGLDTCWFNPMRKPNHTDMIPTYEIKELPELYQILEF
ncbi:2-haloacid dehalogenase [Bacillus oleivorans]|uniref:2-haloacid dehalogenase n=1 Tax=Bacillus oleivorans TaxID=1448271 RepID=A0A285D3H1_9BACI|nr:YjjG family noncanonical pyrimidine nucleotidase [Bacillus oleivorans]SNX74371.1 2-haloacid dehalogenase [Bacillus oleivorans]